MFELGDCEKDGKIDLCDFLSLYSKNPTAHAEDFLAEWRVWANAWAAEGKVATITRLGTVIAAVEGEEEGDLELEGDGDSGVGGGVQLQKLKSGTNPGMDPIRTQVGIK